MNTAGELLWEAAGNDAVRKRQLIAMTRLAASKQAEIERLRGELDFLHTKQDAGVKALCEAVEGGRAAAAVVTIPIWLDELRWAIVEELDSRDELIRAQAAGGGA